MQKSRSSLEKSVAPSTPELRTQLDTLYAAAESSPYVFASPLGPVAPQKGLSWLSRFVFFGPHASDDAWRLCILAGVDPRDTRSARSVLRLIAGLATDADDAHALNLTFFPQLGPSAAQAGQRSGNASWQKSRRPEIALLREDVKTRGYHGFIRIETAESRDGLVVVAREPASSASIFDATWFFVEPASPFRTAFESERDRDVRSGPLSFAITTSSPFEVLLRVPASWSEAAYDHAVSNVIRRFLRQYRAYQAFGGHL